MSCWPRGAVGAAVRCRVSAYSVNRERVPIPQERNVLYTNPAFLRVSVAEIASVASSSTSRSTT